MGMFDSMDISAEDGTGLPPGEYQSKDFECQIIRFRAFKDKNSLRVEITDNGYRADYPIHKNFMEHVGVVNWYTSFRQPIPEVKDFWLNTYWVMDDGEVIAILVMDNEVEAWNDKGHEVNAYVTIYKDARYDVEEIKALVDCDGEYPFTDDIIRELGDETPEQFMQRQYRNAIPKCPIKDVSPEKPDFPALKAPE